MVEQNTCKSKREKRQRSPVWVMRELSRWHKMGLLVFLSQGGKKFYVYQAKKTSRTQEEYTLWARSSSLKVKFKMYIKDEKIIIIRQDDNNNDEGQIVKFYIRKRKGCWNLVND
ncbi:MAG: hypothetical protein GX926_01290 [Candidatus Magasanikbacteria bacterium]|nr:hypothetical protein [Candidatus Magasanikbacteria bacterium]